MSDTFVRSTSIQQNVAQYLRELADKVERSSYCIIEACTDERNFVTYYGKTIANYVPTGEREVTLKLNYIEESV